MQMYVEENAQFQLKVVEKSGLNRDGTYLPPAIHPTFAKEPKYDMKTAMIEAEMVMGGCVADLLEKTGTGCFTAVSLASTLGLPPLSTHCIELLALH